MNTIIALLRGINVGGNNKLPMKELREVLTKMGLKDVQTYIQSGNVVFRSDTADMGKLSESITAAIQNSHGFAPRIILLTAGSLRQAIAANPFPEGESEPKSLHLFFLASPPENPDIAKIESLKSDTENYKLIGSVFYLHAPDGIGRSKLAEKVERALGVPATARNWRSVCQIMAIAEEIAQ